MSYLEKAKDLQTMLAQGQGMEAFEKYYADNCVIVEKPTGETRNGKEAQRKAIQQWYGMIKETHGGGINSITSDEENGITVAETWVDVTMHQGGRMKMEECAVQRWEGDQIVHEAFYFHMPGGGEQPQQ